MGLYIYSFIVTVFLIVAVIFLSHNRIEKKEKAVIEQ